MQQPQFPQDFVRDHCWKVAEASDWRQRFRLPPDPDGDMAFAECAFHSAGAGMECESCEMHLTRPFLGHEVDEKFLPLIEDYYRQMAQWEKEQESERRAEQDACARI